MWRFSVPFFCQIPFFHIILFWKSPTGPANHALWMNSITQSTHQTQTSSNKSIRAQKAKGSVFLLTKMVGVLGSIVQLEWDKRRRRSCEGEKGLSVWLAVAGTLFIVAGVVDVVNRHQQALLSNAYIYNISRIRRHAAKRPVESVTHT